MPQAPRCPECGYLLPDSGPCLICGRELVPGFETHLAEGEWWGVEGNPYAADLMLEGDLFSG